MGRNENDRRLESKPARAPEPGPAFAQRKFSSAIGPLYLVASPVGLRGIFWEKQELVETTAPTARSRDHLDHLTHLDQAERELGEYLAGRRKTFSVALDPRGTEFQTAVWRQLALIPYGETRSYQEIAARVKKPKAYRAVGTANGRNPLSIIVPCHRVINASGTLGGYAGGLSRKERLLRLEREGILP